MTTDEALYKLLLLGPLTISKAKNACGWKYEVFEDTLERLIDSNLIRIAPGAGQRPAMIEAYGSFEAGTGSPDSLVRNASGMAGVRDVEGADAGAQGTPGVQQPAGDAEQRHALEKIWPSSAIYRGKE